MISRSLRVERGSSLKLGRFNSSLLAASEIARITGYERLSESVRLSGHRRRKNRAWAFLSKVFSFRGRGGDRAPAAAEEAEQKKKMKMKMKMRQSSSSSSWLPDPQRRWPVQGW